MDKSKIQTSFNSEQKISPSELAEIFKNATLHIKANVEQNDKINKFVAVGNNNGMINAPEINIYINGDKLCEKPVVPAIINHDFYNLFVVGTEDYEKNYFFVEPERAVSKYERTASEIVEQFGMLDAESIEKIKTFPSIFAAESRFIDYQIDPTQIAYFGFVTDVKVQQNELIKIYFEKLKKIPQQILFNLMAELEICGRPRCSELERTHWAIKKINIVEVLRDAKMDVL